MHQPNVEFNQKKKIHQERERERIFTFLCGKNMDLMKKRKANIYNK